MKHLLTVVSIAALAAGCQPDLPAQISSPSSLQTAREDYRTATKSHLRFLEEREAMTVRLRARGMLSDDEVDVYRFQVAIARYNLAHVQNDQAEAREQFRVAATVRQRQYDRLKRLRERGGGYEAEMNVAERQLASARFRLAHEEGDTQEAIRQLQRIQRIVDQELQRERWLLGRNAATQAEVEDTTYRLIKARYLEARLSAREDDCLQLLHEMLNLTASAWARQQKLQRQGASSKEELDWVQFRHLLAQQRLAAVEAKTDKVREFQNQLLAVTSQMLKHALQSSHATEDEKEYYRWEHALQTYRLALARRGKLPDYENIWELDGWTHIPHQPRG